jgi:hypothetical protein
VDGTASVARAAGGTSETISVFALNATAARLAFGAMCHALGHAELGLQPSAELIVSMSAGRQKLTYNDPRGRARTSDTPPWSRTEQ